MADIIPGVPAPHSGDPKCVISVCARIIAQVDCIIYILQGTTACVHIQLFNSLGEPLDLNSITQMQVLLYNDLDCPIANFWWPSIPTGCKGFEIEILQHTITDGIIVDEGLIRVCLDSSCTGTSPGNIFAELRIVEDIGTTGESQEEIYGIGCLQVAVIKESKIFNSNCDDGCGILT